MIKLLARAPHSKEPRASMTRGEHLTVYRRGLVSVGRDDYETPQELFDKIDSVFHFTLDVAASKDNAKCDRYNTAEPGGTVYPWPRERIWCNPPYSNKESFLHTAVYLQQECQVSVFLLPNNARETLWWNSYVRTRADEIITLSPRVNYLLDGKPTKSVGYPSCLVVYRPRVVGADYGAPREVVWRWEQ